MCFQLTREEFEPDYFPTYCAGGAFIMTNDLPYNLYIESLRTKPFFIDDAYLGVLALALNTTFINIEENYHIGKYIYYDPAIILNEDSNDLDDRFFTFLRYNAEHLIIWKHLLSRHKMKGKLYF